MKGFVKLSRSVQGTWIHKDPVFFKAWCDILFNVNWEPKIVFIGSNRFLCNAGESLNSLDTWADIFGKGWNKSKVRRFFKRLADETIIDTQNERKTTRLKLVGIDVSEDLRHANETQTDTQMKRKPTPTKELRIKNKEEESFDKRINKNLPFDVVTSSSTIQALFMDVTPAIETVKNAYAIEATEQDIKTAMFTFSTVAVASYDKYQGIRTIEKLKNKFIDWIPRSIKYQSQQASSAKSDINEKLDLAEYLSDKVHPVELRKLGESGKLEELQQLLEENKFRLSNIAKGYKNENVSTLLLFEALYLDLGKKLGGSNHKTRLESFQRWIKTLNDYNQNKGDIRQLLKQRNKNLV